eukprot:gene8248-8437_t
MTSSSGLTVLKLPDPLGAAKADYAAMQRQSASALQDRVNCAAAAAASAEGPAGGITSAPSTTAGCGMLPLWVAGQLPGICSTAAGGLHGDLSKAEALTEALAANPINLRPVALPLHPVQRDRGHPAASSSSSSAEVGTSADVADNTAAGEVVELCVPGNLVQQLVADGHRAVRVLVALQPLAKLLLDQKVELPLPSPSNTQPKSGLDSDVEYSSDDVSCDPVGPLMEKSPEDVPPPPAVASAGAMAEPQEAAGPAPPVECMLAHLHLLLLPAEAQAELQGLFQAVQEADNALLSVMKACHVSNSNNCIGGACLAMGTDLFCGMSVFLSSESSESKLKE